MRRGCGQQNFAYHGQGPVSGSGSRVVSRSACSVGQNLSKLPYQWENSFILGMA